MNYSSVKHPGISSESPPRGHAGTDLGLQHSCAGPASRAAALGVFPRGVRDLRSPPGRVLSLSKPAASIRAPSSLSPHGMAVPESGQPGWELQRSSKSCAGGAGGLVLRPPQAALS